MHTFRTLRRRLSFFTVLSLAASPVFAAPQGPLLTALDSESVVARDRRSNWSKLPLPGDFTGVSSVKALGTSVVFKTPSHVYLWTATAMRWASVPASVTAVVTQYNDYTTIEDGNTVHAWATRTGRVETLNFAGVPQVLHGPVSSNWLSIAVFGSDAWSFGAFDGVWHHQSLASTTPTVTIAQTSGLVSDGVNLYGVSAYTGDFVPAPLGASASVAAGGDIAVAWDASTVAGFSAQTATWDSTPLASPNLLTANRGYALFSGGGEVVGFSTCTGTFVRQTFPPGATLSAGTYVAALRSGLDVLAYSSGRNVFRVRTCPSVPVVSVDDEVLAVQDTSGVTAFSVAKGEFSPTVAGSFTVTLNDAMVWIDDGTQAYAFSAIQNTWSAAPLAVTGSVIATVLRNVVVLNKQSAPQSYFGFSGRSGQWLALPVGAGTTSLAPTSGDLYVVFDGPSAIAFDPLILRWASVDTRTPLASSDLWRQTFVGYAAGLVHGFSILSNAWSSQSLEGTFQALDANDACGWALTDTHVYAYAGHGSLSTLSRFPEFSRLQPLGVPLRIHQVAPPGSHVVGLFAHDGAYQPTGTGTLFLDTSSLFLMRRMGVVPSSGILEAAIDLSGEPGLAGTEVHLQSLVIPPRGQAYWSSNAIAPVLF